LFSAQSEEKKHTHSEADAIQWAAALQAKLACLSKVAYFEPVLLLVGRAYPLSRF
jgi:hypothetical protein